MVEIFHRDLEVCRQITRDYYGQKVENPYQRVTDLPVIVTLVIARWMCYNGRCYDAFMRMVGTN